MAEQHPTDQFCKPHEYILERNGMWFIVDVYGRLRIHDEEYPPELRHTPPTPSVWDVPVTIFALILLPLTMVAICIGLAIEHLQGSPADRKVEARQAWEKATYRDAGVYQPILHTWDGTGGMSGGSISADPSWSV